MENNCMDESSKIKLVLTYFICLAICFLLHVMWHELIGHGLVGVLSGGHVTQVDLFGIRLLPELGLSGIPAAINIEDIRTPALHELTVLSGPLSTWCIAVLAVILLWVRRRRGLVKVVLVCLSLWWYDLLSETLLVWGVPKYLFWSRPPGHYDSAIWLGIPGPLFHIFSTGTSVCLLAGLVICLIRDHKRQNEK
jgi:hypothetical protein